MPLGWVIVQRNCTPKGNDGNIKLPGLGHFNLHIFQKKKKLLLKIQLRFSFSYDLIIFLENRMNAPESAVLSYFNLKVTI